MENYIYVCLKSLDVHTGTYINSIIDNELLKFKIISNSKCISIKMDIQIEKKMNEHFMIITEEDYKSLRDIISKSENKIVCYDDSYYITELKYIMEFSAHYQELINIQENVQQKNK